jgi:hypothetical protein
MKIIANKDIANTINSTHNKAIPNKLIIKLTITNKLVNHNPITNRVNIIRHINLDIIDFIIIYNL